MTTIPTEFDLLIVGGGINGAALARLAAHLGNRVGLFEAADFGHGASSNTSKLLHGGLRYLETYAFSLVREAVRERARWLRLAPHLAHEARFHFPLLPQSRRSRWLVKCGMMLYDGLAASEPESKLLGGHAWVPSGDFAQKEPHLLPRQVRGAYAYADCVVDDARLCLETLQDAEALGATVRNYHRVTALHEDGDGVDVSVLNHLTGKEMSLRAKRVAVLAGPWTDSFRREALNPGEPWVRPSQGIHLVVDGLDARECLILPVPDSARYFFVLPYQGYALVGTTETEIVGDLPESPLPMQAEIDELQALLRLYFADQNPRLISVFAGVRPLARASAKQASNHAAKVSREHTLHRIGDRIVGAVGGKYTTHRPLALDLYRHLHRQEKTMAAQSQPSRDIEAEVKGFSMRPLPGAWKSPTEKQALVDELARTKLPGSLAGAWVNRYGVKAREVLAFCRGETDGLAILSGCEDVALGEIGYAMAHEYVRTPVDFLRRRTRLFFTPHGGLAALPEILKRIDAQYPSAQAMLGESADYMQYLKRYRHISVTALQGGA